MNHNTPRISHATVDTVHGGIPKKDRYEWSDPGPKSQFAWVDKRLLSLPPEGYQRDQETQERKIKLIAAKFCWAHFAVLTVVRRPGDPLMYIIDGGGRHAAAMRRTDITDVPCMIVDIDSLKEEARAFWGLNVVSSNVDAVTKLNSLTVAEDPVALMVSELISQAGRIAQRTSGPGTVACVHLLQSLARQDAGRLRRLWPLLTEICRGHIMHERLVAGVFYVDKYMQGPGLLTDPKYRRRLLSIGYTDLVAGIVRAAAYYARGGASVFGRGVVETYNKGLHEHTRIVLVEAPLGRRPDRGEE